MFVAPVPGEGGTTFDPGTGGDPGATQPGGAPAALRHLKIPGATPDYKALIESDPWVLQNWDALKAQGVQSAAQRTAMRQRAITQYGAVPDFMKAGADLGLLGQDIGQDITPEIAALAQQNTEAGLSTTARLSKAHSDAVRQIQNYLGARGMARSGETGYQLENEDQNFAQGSYDSVQKLLDYLAGVQSAFTQGEQQRLMEHNAAAERAAPRVIAANPTTGDVELTETGPGTGIYTDGNGNYYDGDKNKIPAPDKKGGGDGGVGDQTGRDRGDLTSPTTLPWNPSAGAYGPDANGRYYDKDGNVVTASGQPPASTQPWWTKKEGGYGV